MTSDAETNRTALKKLSFSPRVNLQNRERSLWPFLRIAPFSTRSARVGVSSVSGTSRTRGVQLSRFVQTSMLASFLVMYCGLEMWSIGSAGNLTSASAV